ncbi:MAG: DUF6602 domain-containing protein, partial [Acidobacteriota bacterium]
FQITVIQHPQLPSPHHLPPQPTPKIQTPRYPPSSMPRSPDSGHINLAEVFRRVQTRMLADLSVIGLLEHASTNGAAAEHNWIKLFSTYLPKRFRATSAFIINSAGRRSRQIDIAIYDQLHSPPLFPAQAGAQGAIHLPIESVYAVFEVKPTISKQWLRDAGEKAASVRALRPRQPLLAGLLATSSVWNVDKFQPNLRRALAALPRAHSIEIGCALEHGSFDGAAISPPESALIFFTLRLIHRLNTMEAQPTLDILDYLNKAA